MSDLKKNKFKCQGVLTCAFILRMFTEGILLPKLSHIKYQCQFKCIAHSHEIFHLSIIVVFLNIFFGKTMLHWKVYIPRFEVFVFAVFNYLYSRIYIIEHRWHHYCFFYFLYLTPCWPDVLQKDWFTFRICSCNKYIRFKNISKSSFSLKSIMSP